MTTAAAKPAFRTLTRGMLEYTKLTTMMNEGMYNVSSKANEIYEEDPQWDDFGLANFRKAYNAIKKAIGRKDNCKSKGKF